jgi:hypothetical protein
METSREDEVRAGVRLASEAQATLLSWFGEGVRVVYERRIRDVGRLRVRRYNVRTTGREGALGKGAVLPTEEGSADA